MQVIYLLYYFQDYLKNIIIMKMAFGYRTRKNMLIPVFGVLFSVVFAAGSFFSGYDSDTFQMIYSFFDLTCIILVCLSVEGQKKILFSILSYLLVNLLDDSLSRAVADLTGKEYSVFTENKTDNIILMTVSLGIYYTVFRILKQITGKSGNDIDIRKSRSIDIVVIIGAIILTFFTAALLKKSGYDRIVFVFASSCIMILCMFYNNASHAYFREKSHMNEKIIDAQKKYYENLLEKENETRKFRHDINNHLLCIRSMLNEGKYKEAENYIYEIEKKTATLKRGCQTGNDLVNTILNDISGKYKNVELTTEGLIPAELSISDMDICTVFYNIFENAFSAASECSENAMVYLSSRSVASSMVFTVKNNMNRPVNKKGHSFVSYKSDRANHGFGTVNVKECVEANGGKVEFSYSENEFTVVIILPNVIA